MYIYLYNVFSKVIKMLPLFPAYTRLDAGVFIDL